MSERRPTVLLTGATGYVGGRLLPLLEGRGVGLRCLVRRPEALTGRHGDATEIVVGDAQDLDSLRRALDGVEVAYYLLHSMGEGGDFEEQERRMARTFARAAKEAGVRRLIYLGGLGRGADLSPHLETRQEVGRLLRESGAAVIEFRASIIIGSGSLSFEMVRALVEKLPVMITPRWVASRAQPIAIEDVLAYLLAAVDGGAEISTIYEIGGAERVSYRELMEEYARQRGLRRHFLPVPMLTPRLSSLWLGLVTPLFARVGRKLIEGVRNETVVEDDRALRDFAVSPLGISAAIERALHNEDREFATTRWSDAFSALGPARSWGGVRFGTRLVDTHAQLVPVSPPVAFAPVRRIGGARGWYFGNWLWRVRGFLDLLIGGPGLRRGRRDPETPFVGDAIDFWRVEAYEPDRLLRLRAEMNLPGRAWLQLEAEPHPEGTLLRQTALFDPAGLFGLVYWYALYPLHEIVFRGMLHRLAQAAARDVAAAPSTAAAPRAGRPR